MDQQGAIFMGIQILGALIPMGCKYFGLMPEITGENLNFLQNGRDDPFCDVVI
jgi:hypothetical protein